MLNATQSYRQAQVNTVGRADITLMLYDGLLRFLDLAANAMERKQIQEKGNYISRALDIINELDSTLNMEKGGEVSKGLHNLYLITNKNLLMANLKNDLVVLKSCRDNMQVVRDSFHEAMQTEEAKQMLAKMGPVPMANTNGAQVNFGGSIQERTNRIKESQQKILAIQKAKEQLEKAQTEEEKALAKKELEALLGKNVLAKDNQKPVSASMAQKANRAFMQQQGFSRPLSSFSSASLQKGNGAGQGLHSSVQNLGAQQSVQQSMQQSVPQPVVSQPLSAQAMSKMASPYIKQAGSAMAQSPQQTGQSMVLNAKMAPLNEKLLKENPVDTVSQEIEKNPAQAEQKAPLSPMGAMPQLGSGLLGKKMALYKNL